MEIQPFVFAFGLIRRSSAEPCVVSFPATDSLTHKTHPSTTSTFTRPPCRYQTTLCTHTHLASWPAVQTTSPLCVATGMQRRVCLSTWNKKLGVCVCVCEQAKRIPWHFFPQVCFIMIPARAYALYFWFVISAAPLQKHLKFNCLLGQT